MPTSSSHDRMMAYLVDAHAIEEQSLQQLRAAPDIAGEPGLAEALREHLDETRDHERRVRALLEGRDASPSGARDAFMRAGGSGFMLFARSQVDTPGKLASHALSYEALEWSAYDILARTAEHAGDREVVAVAEEIRDQERTMMERLEGLFDRTAQASLEAGPDHDAKGQLRTYLADAHAIEAQSLQLLRSGRRMVDEGEWETLFELHRDETLRQQRILAERLEAVSGSRSFLKDAAMRIGALNWGMFFRAQPDTTVKLAGFAYAFEYLEIGGYEQLLRVAARAGDQGTVDAVRGILAEERRAANRFAEAFEGVLVASLAT